MTRILTRSFALIAAFAVLAACATTNPMSVAQSIEQRAYVAERSYNIVLTDALAVVRDPNTPASVKQAIKDASASASPILTQLDQAAAAATVERAKFNAGQSTVDKVEVLSQNLQRWIDKAEASMVAMRAIFKQN